VGQFIVEKADEIIPVTALPERFRERAQFLL
jgi:hypothetical protein